MSTTKLLLSGTMLLAGGSLFGQTSLTCASEDGGRHYCGADTRRGVQMVKQRSGSACREGYSWGTDSRGVWVDHGCRADFVVGAAGNRDMRGDRRDDRGDYRDRDRNYGTANAASTLTCASEDGGRHYCAADTRRGVQLVQQRSGSACREGYSWGPDSRGLWGRSRLPCGFRRRHLWDCGWIRRQSAWSRPRRQVPRKRLLERNEPHLFFRRRRPALLRR